MGEASAPGNRRLRCVTIAMLSRGTARQETESRNKKELQEQGTYADFFEGLKVFDKEESGKILCAELRHILLALGERLSADEADELLKGIEDGEGMVKYDGQSPSSPSNSQMSLLQISSRRFWLDHSQTRTRF